MRFLFIPAFLLIALTGRTQPLFMSITDPQINGNQVTYDVKTANFNNIAAFQYSISFDIDIHTGVQ